MRSRWLDTGKVLFFAGVYGPRRSEYCVGIQYSGSTLGKGDGMVKFIEDLALN